MTSGAHDRASTAVTFKNAAGNDFRIAITDTQAKGAGLNLSADSLFSFTVDITAVTRAAPSDVGASVPY